MKINRRDFLKYSIRGVATVVVGSRLLGFQVPGALAASQTLNITITDAIKEMATHNAVNTARCYFWIYKMSADGIDIPAECPGPNIIIAKGDTVNITIKNNLDEPHAFFIPGIFDSNSIAPGGIQPGQTVSGTINTTNASSGAHLYYDNLNSPVNRMMGLHGAFIVIRNEPPLPGNKYTPYDINDPIHPVQQLYNDFGSTNHFPGLAWEEGYGNPGDPGYTPPFRRYIWLLHQASPNLFAEVGNYTPGQDYPAQRFMDKFLRDPFSPTGANGIAQYFTINGQSGTFSHFSPYITPMTRVGEPLVVHILNAGLWTHSMHLHANHFYVTSVNGVIQDDPLWLDVYNVEPMDINNVAPWKVDYTVPSHRPPDVPNIRGIGMPDAPLTSLNGTPVWPPVEEIAMYIPAPGEDVAKDINGNPIDLAQRLSPLCYPMHDHSEPSQTAQGGNYNMGLISGIYFIGDRNALMDFPMDEDFRTTYKNIRGVSGTGQAAPPLRG